MNKGMKGRRYVSLPFRSISILRRNRLTIKLNSSLINEGFFVKFEESILGFTFLARLPMHEAPLDFFLNQFNQL